MENHALGWRLLTSFCALIGLAVYPAVAGASVPTTSPENLLTRDQIIEDIRELSQLLESAHPDPYLHGGGKVAYHRRLQELIRSVPEEGLPKQELHALLQPFVAKLGDGHTTLPLDQARQDYRNPRGIPLYFEVIDQRLWVAAVTGAGQLGLIGATLEAVEGVPFADLLQRESQQRGHDNLHHVLSGLARYGALYYRESLRGLVPEWENDEEIEVLLRLPSGTLQEYSLPPAESVEYPLLRKTSRLELPDTERSFSYHFLDEKKELAFLRIDNMTTYREMFEYSRSVGSSGYESWARRVFARFNEEDPPANIDEVIAGIPSATETFSSLFQTMKQARSRALIVDLRRNFGGNDLMVQIFLYFLVGFDETISLMERTAAIQKLSPLFDESTEAGVDLQAIEYAASVPLTLSDYDFSSDAAFMSGPELDQSLRTSYQRMFEQMPTFYAFFGSRREEALYFPERLVVLCGNATQSSGFDLLTNLYRLGAEVVGVPSSQAGNGFGNIRRFELTHSGVAGYVSTKYFLAYPEGPATGFTLEPQHLLTYPELAAYGFDKNASLLLALELLGAAD